MTSYILNPFTNRLDATGMGSSTPGVVDFLEGNTGGAVGPSGAGVINVVGGTGINIPGTPGSNTLTVNATPLSGATVQYLYTKVSTLVTCSTVIPFDNTIPQNTEGDEVITLTITPKSATNILKIEFNTFLSSTPVSQAALFQDSNVNALAACYITQVNPNYVYGNGSLIHSMVGGTTSATTFKIRVGPHVSAPVYVNGDLDGVVYGGVASTTLTITEYQA